MLYNAWLCEPDAWRVAYDNTERGINACDNSERRLNSLRRIVYHRETPKPLPSSEVTDGPAALYLRFALDPTTVNPATIHALALTCRSWSAWVRHALQSEEFEPFWQRVIYGMAPHSMLHPECASKERLRGWLRGVEKREWLHMERSQLSSANSAICIHPRRTLSMMRTQQASIIWDGYVSPLTRA